MAKKSTSANRSKSPLTDALRSAIEASGKTSYQLREETGVNHGVILRFMKGERDIRLETADKLAVAVGLTCMVTRTEPARTEKAEGGGASPKARTKHI